MNPYEVEASVAIALEARGWRRSGCTSCDLTMFRKDAADVCGSPSCHREHESPSRPARRRPLPDLGQLYSQLVAAFGTRGVAPAPAVPVIKGGGDTLFVVAAIQARYPDLYRTGRVALWPRSDRPVLVAQPSVRWAARAFVGKQAGWTTSFVNTAVLQSPSSPTRHVELLDTWLDVLSHLGIFVPSLSLTLRGRVLEMPSAAAELTVWKVHVYLEGIELGDAAYLVGHDADGREISVSDLGFGLEQMALILGVGEHLDLLAPWPFGLRAEVGVVDALRTLPLLVGSGGRPGGRSSGQRIRTMAKDLAPLVPELPLWELTRYYHRFWSAFVALPVGLEETYAVIRAELDDQYIARIADLLGVNAPQGDRGQDLDHRLRALQNRARASPSVRAADQELRRALEVRHETGSRPSGTVSPSAHARN